MICNSIGVNTQINLPIVIVTGMATSVAEAVRKNRDASGLAVIISNDYGTTPGLENLIGGHITAKKKICLALRIPSTG